MSFTGNTTTDRYTEFLRTEHVESGLLNRFLILQRKSPLVDRKFSDVPNDPFPDDIAQTLAAMRSRSIIIEEEQRHTIQYADGNAAEYADWLFMHYTHERRRISEVDPTRGRILGRSAEKIMRVAAILAVSSNPSNPLITREHMEWSKNLVDRCDGDIVKYYDQGLMGVGQSVQQATILYWMKQFHKLPLSERKKLLPEKFAVRNFVPENWLRDRSVTSPAFVRDNRAMDAFERMSLSLYNQNRLLIVTHELIEEAYGCRISEIPITDPIHQFIIHGVRAKNRPSTIFQIPRWG